MAICSPDTILWGGSMHPDRDQEARVTNEAPGFVSGRFLSDLFRSLERHNVPATQMLGDLPIPVDQTGRVTQPVEWSDFADFMKRLEHHVGGPEGLEACGERVGEFKPAWALLGLVGFSASPNLLYRTASLWALRRAIPGIETRIKNVHPNRLEIRVRLKDGLRPCPQLFHLATGAARALPRILGMCDAVVSAKVGDFEAQYQITVPPSRTIWARVTCVFRTLFSASSVFQFLEAQQLELHAKHEALQKSHAALAESESRYRAITDTAVDVLCELDEQGRIIYVSPSVEDLMGYSPEQVTGSHFSLWVPGEYRDLAKRRFAAFIARPIEQPITRERLRLQTETGGYTIAEFSLRSYRTPEGELRMVGILRDETDRPARGRKVGTRDERNDSNGFRSIVERLRHSTSEHPIERSLAVLLAALESNPSDHDDHATGRIIAATERMTQIVESAMIHASDPSLSFGWLETKKLVDMVNLEFRANRASAELELQIDMSNAPTLVWGEDTLLAVGLGSLLDWAAEGACGATEITLQIQATGDRAHNEGSVVFSVSSSSSTSNCDPFDPIDPVHAEGAATLDARSSLALATAEDAASALGGDLVLPEESARHSVSRIRLPQPQHGH